MLKFKALAIEDRRLLAEHLATADRQACHENLVTIYMWAEAADTHWAECGDWLFLRNKWQDIIYHYPLGRGDIREALALLREETGKLMLRNVTEPQCAELAEACPGEFTFTEDTDVSDYVYSVERLASLKGNKLHAKRNHIRRFEDVYPDWSFELLTSENQAEVELMSDEWCRRYGCKEDRGLRTESCAVARCFQYREELGVLGGVLRAGGEVVAFSLGSRLGSEFFDIHVEKAYHEMQGAYPLVNREMARLVASLHPEVRWLNREDDAGKEGLRKAKKSYYPDLMVKKYVVTEQTAS
jgi:hypothetical protein